MTAEYPPPIVPVDHVAPVPRRIRATLDGRTVVATERARYVWEIPPYPQYYVPLADVVEGVLVDEHEARATSRGTAHRHAVRAAGGVRAAAADVYRDDAIDGVRDTVRVRWDALDEWYEEDEQVFVHPRNPYARVDAIRSTRDVRIELGGVVLARSHAPVMVFETGLPPRTYVSRSDVDFTHLVPSDTVTACPYKGRTTGYWSARIDGVEHGDIAWTYDFPTAALLPIAGMIAFYDEHVDVTVDGVAQQRPTISGLRAARGGDGSSGPAA